uniref:Uncharacterized protein n=1 Tax=Anopheles albimanus TaxID=7167 RepID=A0A182FX68_ANOAL
MLLQPIESMWPGAA